MRESLLPLCLLGLCLFVLGSLGCSSSPELGCGPGTVEVDGECVSADQVTECGPGTYRVGDRCELLGDMDLPNPDCQPDCEGRTCGDDGCGSSCGACPEESPYCSPQGQCEQLRCEPFCLRQWECGDDGCGGSCGTCDDPNLPFCSPDRDCVEECVPDCEGKSCGPDGCGGTCGSCAEEEACSTIGACVPPTWSCEPTWYQNGTVCDCDCGAPDPDCADPQLPVGRCQDYQRCNDQGRCEDTIPAAWSCAPEDYEDGFKCHCDCGTPDPDCADDSLVVANCLSGICQADNTCAPCTPDCTGKECGDNGCGGSCGGCDDPAKPACHNFACVDVCNPTPLACLSAQCGSDGCGGSCGSCAADELCIQGACRGIAAQSSCVNHCGAQAPGGCSCDAGCAARGDCCPDYQSACAACTPDCSNKNCGDDGCGGSCGTCDDPMMPICDPMTQQCVPDNCTPDCSNKNCGDDGCGGSCGTCDDPDFNTCSAQGRCIDPSCTPDCSMKACGGDGCGGLCPSSCQLGERCSFDNTCLPFGWHCVDGAFAGGLECNAGCGAFDPDCLNMMLPVVGCPMGATLDMTNGSCIMPRCEADADCAMAGQNCQGEYHETDGIFSGRCAMTDTMALPAGSGCMFESDCQSGLCVDFVCRDHCRDDMDCGAMEACLAVEITGAAIGVPYTDGYIGRIAVCVPNPGASCTQDTDCLGAMGEQCLGFVDGATRSPRYLCQPLTGFPDELCSEFSPACPTGQHCQVLDTPWDPGGTCRTPCPGGQADCAMGEVCQTIAVDDNNTESAIDDITMPVCLP